MPGLPQAELSVLVVFGKASSTAAFMCHQMVVDSPKRKRDGARRAAEGVCEASKRSGRADDWQDLKGGRDEVR